MTLAVALVVAATLKSLCLEPITNPSSLALACIEHCEHGTSDLEPQASDVRVEGGEGEGDSQAAIAAASPEHLGAFTMTGTGIPFTRGAATTAAAAAAGETHDCSSISGVDGGVDERRSRASSDESLDLFLTRLK